MRKPTKKAAAVFTACMFAALAAIGTAQFKNASSGSVDSSAMAGGLNCTYKVHEHKSSCYNTDGDLVCGYADWVVHTHDENCYDKDGTLICTLGEHEAHIHGDSCYVTVTDPDSITGGALDVTGGSVDVTGDAVDVSGGSVNVTGNAVDVTGDAVNSKLDARVEAVRKILKYKNEIQAAVKQETKKDVSVTDIEAADADSEGIQTLSAGKEAEHVHTDDCILKFQVLACDERDSDDGSHTHTDSCYLIVQVYTCGDDAGSNVPGSGNTDADNEDVDNPGNNDNTVSGGAVSGDAVSGDAVSGDAVSGDAVDSEDHVHTDDCFVTVRVPICGYPEATGDAADVTGGAIGDSAFMDEATKSKLDKVNELIEKVPEAKDTDAMSDWFGEVKGWAKENDYGTLFRDAENGMLFISSSSKVADFRDATLTELKDIKKELEGNTVSGGAVSGEAVSGEAVSGEAVSGGHVHTDECYVTVRIPVCGQGSDDAQVLVCKEPTLHTHTKDCFKDSVWVCHTLQLEEHVHGEDCMAHEAPVTTGPAVTTGPSISDEPSASDEPSNTMDPGTSGGNTPIVNNPGDNNNGSGSGDNNNGSTYSWSDSYGSGSRRSSSGYDPEGKGDYEKEIIKTGEDSVILFVIIGILAASGGAYLFTKSRKGKEEV